MSKDFKEGEHEFTFPNGDKYEGHFCAHVSGLAWRQGHGTYYTHEGQQYEGTWKDDKLDESQNVKITFFNDSLYEGKIFKYKYNGPGAYWFKNNDRLVCEFLNNKPVGDLIYIDPHGRLWYGRAESDSAIFYREHVFSDELDEERGKGVPLNPPVTEEVEEEAEPEESDQVDMKELERITFAKSTKTDSNINFEESEWFQDFQKFTEMHQNVMTKIKESGLESLSPLEEAWYQKFLESAEILKQRKTKKMKDLDFNVLKNYLKKKSLHTCPPTSVLYPTQIEEQVEQ